MTSSQAQIWAPYDSDDDDEDDNHSYQQFLRTALDTPVLRSRRRSVTWAMHNAKVSDREFKQMYRLTRQEFRRLHDILISASPGFVGERRSKLDSRLRLASCLRHLAGGNPIDVRYIHGQTSQSQFSEHFFETIEAINSSLHLSTDWRSRNTLATISASCGKSGVDTDTIFRGCAGYVDGIVIRCQKPSPGDPAARQIRDFRCHRKRMWGLNVQAICDGDLRIHLFKVCGGGGYG